MRQYQVALIQMDTRDDKQANLAAAKGFVEQAALRGAKLVVLPETMNFIGRGYSAQAEPIPGGETCQMFQELAQKHSIWIETGSIPETVEGAKPRNTAMLIDPNGRVVCKYSKMHMFDVDITNGPVSYTHLDVYKRQGWMHGVFSVFGQFWQTLSSFR